ncbi:MAG TPA: tetratricopeptide repeat protein [Pyrinomonadaceae bacterium]|nr:tetratricopeptide repeat protein [Pyrinomonadaceae bacterium]
MRDLLTHADLARYAGQFVWLELSYDEPQNREFLTRYGANATPTLFVIDPRDGLVAAMQAGAMSLPELKQFLDRGAGAVLAKRQTPADVALRRGDTLMAQQPAEAAKEYLRALELAPVDWPSRELTEASEVQALQNSRQRQPCAEAAANYAGTMKRDELFVRTVVSGMWCLPSTDPSPAINALAEKLRPLAEEALSLPITVRDHRDSIYRTLMYIEVARGDSSAALKWGERWLAELEAIKPRGDDERSALDIARVENIQIVGDPARILPALRESEKAMPNNYNASLRLAQMEVATKQFDEAISACQRGLARRPGALSQTWLLETEAEALEAKGRSAEARQALQEALTAAERIPGNDSREHNLVMINRMLKASSGQPK